MATGYTSPVADGTITSAKEFAERCVRNFGIAVMMRDEPMDAKLPEQFKVEEYYIRSLDSAKAALSEFTLSTDEERALQFEKYVADELAGDKKYLQEKADIRARYEAMIETISAWEVTPDWINLKQFMLDQLNESMKWDCNDSCNEQRISRLETMTFEEWEQSTLESLRRSVTWAEESLAKEVARVDERNRMLGTFQESLARLEGK